MDFITLCRTSKIQWASLKEITVSLTIRLLWSHQRPHLLNTKWAPWRCLGLFHNFIEKSPVQIDLRTLRALGWGEPPTNNFLYSNPPQGTTFVCWPPPKSLPFRVFQTGSLQGVPPGVNIWGRPLAQGEMRSPRQISG